MHVRSAITSSSHFFVLSLTRSNLISRLDYFAAIRFTDHSYSAPRSQMHIFAVPIVPLSLRDLCPCDRTLFELLGGSLCNFQVLGNTSSLPGNSAADIHTGVFTCLNLFDTVAFLPGMFCHFGLGHACRSYSDQTLLVSRSFPFQNPESDVFFYFRTGCI